MTNSRSFTCAGPVAYYFPEQILHICFIAYQYIFTTRYSSQAFSSFKHAPVYNFDQPHCLPLLEKIKAHTLVHTYASILEFYLLLSLIFFRLVSENVLSFPHTKTPPSPDPIRHPVPTIFP